MIVLDASVLIAHLETTDTHHGRATQLLVETVDEPLAISPFTLAEVLVGPARANAMAAAHAAVRELDIVTVAFDRDAPTRLAVIRAETRLRMPDCCVILAAESIHGTVATFDERLVAASTERALPVLS